MKRRLTTILCILVCTCSEPALVAAQDASSRGVPRISRGKGSAVLDENIRVVLRIERPDAEPLSMSVVTAQTRVKLDNLAGAVEIDGNKVPIILRFHASLEPLGEGEYLVSCVYGTSTPIVTSSPATKDGSERSSFQYRDIAVDASVRLKKGRAVTILKDPDKKVSIELQSVEE